jgi:hypothetical protein
MLLTLRWALDGVRIGRVRGRFGAKPLFRRGFWLPEPPFPHTIGALYRSGAGERVFFRSAQLPLSPEGFRLR